MPDETSQPGWLTYSLSGYTPGSFSGVGSFNAVGTTNAEPGVLLFWLIKSAKPWDRTDKKHREKDPRV